MDFGLSDEQQLLKASARAFLERESPESHVRAMETDSTGYSPELWAKMAGLGWHGLALPEEHGGAALSFLELALLTEEMGRVLLPGPFIVNALCAALLSIAGSTAQQAELLPGIADGRAIHSYACLEPSAEWRPSAITMTAIGSGPGFRLDGTKLFVANANVAELLHVWARRPGGTLAVFLVSPGQPGVELAPLQTIARDRQFEVRFSGVEVSPEQIVDVTDDAARRWANLATTLECAYLLGLAERDLELTVAYAKQRRQFGQPLGAFQAVQHRAANMRIDVDGMRVVTYRAAWAVSQNEPAQDIDVAVAKAFCSDASRRVVGHGQQVHGGIGFTRDHPVQLYFRRQKRAELAWGHGGYHRARLAELLSDDGAP